MNMKFESVNKELLQKLNEIEACLRKSDGQFINGKNPSSLDRDYLKFVLPFKLRLSPLTHPRAFAWYGLVHIFSEKAQALWPQVETLPVKAKKDT